MLISKERLIKEKEATGHRQEIIEKVVWLIQVLNAFNQDGYLSPRFALKGGTALNLFHFDLPRLSVDADFNYIGSLDRDIMIREKEESNQRIQSLLERLGLTLVRNPRAHAGGKMVWRYPSALGNFGNIEIDLNYMYRVPLLDVANCSSVSVANQQVENIKLLDLHEIAAGKLAALVDRQASRDLFDADQIFNHPSIDIKKLRLLFVVYVAMIHKKDLRELNPEDIGYDQTELNDKLTPMLSTHINKDLHMNTWSEILLKSVREKFNSLLPFNLEEQQFITLIKNERIISPEAITIDSELGSRIKSHPALLWACNKA